MMMLGRSAVLSALAVALLPALHSAQAQQQCTVVEERSYFDIRVKIILNEVETVKPVRGRRIFVLMDDHHFSREKLQSLLIAMATENPLPYELQITVFNDCGMLQRAIASVRTEVFVDFDDSPAGRKAATEYYSKHEPATSGYYRAIYNRYGQYEYLDYSPTKDELMVRITLKSPPLKPEETRDPSALARAVSEGNASLVEQLLSNRVDVDVPDRDGMTPLALAAVNDHAEIAKMLIKHGASVDLKARFGFTALVFACIFARVDIVNTLIAGGANVNLDVPGGTPLMAAAEHGKLETVLALLRAGAKVNAKTDSGYTALMNAADSRDLVEALLSAGADIDARDSEGKSALFYAIQLDRAEKVEALLKKCADPNSPDKNGITPLMLAERMNVTPNHVRIMQLLKQAGAKNPI